MDDTMSSYSFSHQFYQRWTCAPEPIRAAITQELEDITTLLQVETPFESFVFQTHDLDSHVDELYENYEAEQAIAKAIADKQAQARAAAEQQRLEEEKRQAVEDAKRKEGAELAEKTRLREEAEAAQKEQERNALVLADKNNLDESVATVNEDHSDAISADNNIAYNDVASSTSKISTGNNSTENSTAKNSSDTKTISEHANAIADNNIKNDNSVKQINDKASAAISFVLKDAKSSVTHQELIRELEIQIDDYLSDQMMLMSENLKSWLRAEVTQHLSEQGTSTSLANENVAKKSID